MIALFVAVPLWRIYEIPVKNPGVILSDYTRPMTAEEKATYDLYREADSHFVPRKEEEKQPEGNAAGADANAVQETPAEEGVAFPPDSSHLAKDAASSIQPPTQTKPVSGEVDTLTPNDLAWLDANQETIALAMKASRGQLFVPVSETPKALPVDWRVYTLLEKNAVRLESEGKLDEALECILANIRIRNGFAGYWPWRNAAIAPYRDLLRWAARPNQTPERLRAALHELEPIKIVVPRAAFVQVYVAMRAALSSVEGFSRSELYNPRSRVPTGTIVWLHLPWERKRALRKLDDLMSEAMDTLRDVGDGMLWCNIRPTPDELSRWMEQQDLPWAIHTAINVPPLESHGCFDWYTTLEVKRQYVELLTVHRGVCMALALAAWRLEHGSLPKTGEELLNACDGKLPIDPFTATPFRYFPEGVPTALTNTTLFFARSIALQVPPGKPLLWSAGRYVLFREEDAGERGQSGYAADKPKVIPSNCTIYTRDGHRHCAQSEAELWNAGVTIPIPMPPLPGETKKE
jgi:hypothetical protein